MADETEKAKRVRRRRRRASDATSPAKGKRTTRKETRKEPKEKPSSGLGVVGYILPIVSLVVAFVAVAMLYHRLIPPAPATADTEASTAIDPQVAASSSNIQEYYGLEDQWVSSAVFTTGNKELDVKVKQFCDALTVEGASASDNARKVYNTIVWSDVEGRAESEKPTGNDWDKIAALHYFSTGSPEDGLGGAGDVYDFAAVTSFCLRYFGYTDALAIPVILSSQEGGALVVVTDEDGRSMVCDPSLAANGWMLDRSAYSIVVEDIEQNLDAVEAMGLSVQKSASDEQGLVEQGGANGPSSNASGAEGDTNGPAAGNATGPGYGSTDESAYGSTYDSAYDSSYDAQYY